MAFTGAIPMSHPPSDHYSLCSAQQSELTAFLRHDVAQTYGTALALPAYEALFDFARCKSPSHSGRRRVILFAAISLGASPDVVDAGRPFFSELLHMDEDELARSQTSRAEINEVLAELRETTLACNG